MGRTMLLLYTIVGAAGSFVEHNRTTTTSTVCYSSCWPVSSLFSSSYFLFLSLSLRRPIEATTSASWQRSSRRTSERASQDKQYLYVRTRESDSLLFPLFENLMHLLFFLLFFLSFVYVCFARQHAQTNKKL